MNTNIMKKTISKRTLCDLYALKRCTLAIKKKVGENDLRGSRDYSRYLFKSATKRQLDMD